jgi:hypothetical protein
MQASLLDGVTITLNEFENGRIFQRQDNQADIIVSGVYTGAVAGIEARVIGHDSREEVVPWTIIDEDPHNGIFLGALSGVPVGLFEYAVNGSGLHPKADWGTG